MAERSKAAVLKTARGKPLVGSNPTPSASLQTERHLPDMKVYPTLLHNGYADQVAHLYA